MSMSKETMRSLEKGDLGGFMKGHYPKTHHQEKAIKGRVRNLKEVKQTAQPHVIKRRGG